MYPWCVKTNLALLQRLKLKFQVCPHSTSTCNFLCYSSLMIPLVSSCQDISMFPSMHNCQYRSTFLNCTGKKICNLPSVHNHSAILYDYVSYYSNPEYPNESCYPFRCTKLAKIGHWTTCVVVLQKRIHNCCFQLLWHLFMLTKPRHDNIGDIPLTEHPYYLYTCRDYRAWLYLSVSPTEDYDKHQLDQLKFALERACFPRILLIAIPSANQGECYK